MLIRKYLGKPWRTVLWSSVATRRLPTLQLLIGLRKRKAVGIQRTRLFNAARVAACGWNLRRGLPHDLCEWRLEGQNKNEGGDKSKLQPAVQDRPRISQRPLLQWLR